MQRTKEIEEVLEKVVKRCKDELGLSISIDEAFAIANHQFAFVADNIKKDNEVKLPKFGSFVRQKTVSNKYLDKMQAKGIMTEGVKNRIAKAA